MKFEVSCLCLTWDPSNFGNAQTVQPQGQLIMHICKQQDFTLQMDEKTRTKNSWPQCCLCQDIYSELKVLKIPLLK